MEKASIKRLATTPLLLSGVVLFLVFALVRMLHASVWLAVSILLILFALFCAYLYARQSLASLHASTSAESKPRQVVAVFVGVAIGLSSLVFSVLIPPMQSPDEYAHVSRAYALASGDVFMEAVGKRENQTIDKGMLAYMADWSGYLAFKSDVQVSKKFDDEMRLRDWSEQEVAQYNPAGAYFPALYAPASAALALARQLKQPPWIAVYWARLAMWAVSVLAILLALCIVRSGFYLMCAVGMLPMTLAQLGSANLDSMTIGFTFLAIALMSSGVFGGRDGARERDVSTWRLLGCWLIIVLLVLAKPIFVVLLMPPLWFAVTRRSRLLAACSLATLAMVALWQLHIARNFALPNPSLSGSPVMRLVDTLLSPLDTFALLSRTVIERYEFYWESMIGILGWLDTPLNPGLYAFAGVLLIMAVIADMVSPNPSPVSLRILPALVGIAYFFGTLLLLWVTWTPPGSPFIEGVQGRYFLPMLPVLALAFGVRKGNSSVAGAAGWVFLFSSVAFVISVVVDVPSLLLARYWL